MKTPTMTLRRGFTLIELIAVIVVLAILSAVAVPRYFDYAANARSATVRATLGAVRSAVANFYANSLLNSPTAAFPTLAQMQTPGTVMNDPIPSNLYNNGTTIAAGTWTAATSNTPNPAQTVTGNAGWNYDATAGKFWPNSNTTSITENTW